LKIILLAQNMKMIARENNLKAVSMNKKGTMEHLLAYSTIALAFFTAWMAFETRRMANESREASYR
jgi:hypothetical protein